MFAAPVKTRNSRAACANAAAGRSPQRRVTRRPAIGNQAALRLLSALQAKLRVSQPDDPAELEAERAAAQIMAAPQTDLARPGNGAQQNQTAGAPGGIGGVSADASIPADVRTVMESRFGADFSAVRIHHDTAANQLADAFDARAFTVGRDIFFARDQFAPSTDTGKRLIAHELAHVLQQGGAGMAASLHTADRTDLMRQATKPETPAAEAPETPTPMPEEETTTEDEEGVETELSLDIGFTLGALAGLKTDALAGAGTPRIDRQPKKPTPKPKAAAPKPSGVTVQPVQVLPDKEGATEGGTDGETDFKIRPNFTWKTKNGKISSFSGNVSRTIQTTYQPGVDKKANSAYGRGTTDADKKAGNTSLQFHESNHVQDYKDYFDKNKLPEFTGKEGMTEDEFKKAVEKYKEELQQYSDAAKAASKASTDCVGVKEKTCQ